MRRRPLHLARVRSGGTHHAYRVTELLGEFFDEVTEFRKDQFFHGQAHRIL